MKLGNYKWRICNKCGDEYVIINGKQDKHKCNKETFFTKIKNILKQKIIKR